MVRSILAVIAGFVVMTGLVILFTMLAASVLYPGQPMGAPVEPSRGWIAVNLTYSLLAAVAGGWVTAKLARRKRMTHAAVLAVIVLAFSVPGMLGIGSAGQPGGYPLVMVGIGILGVLAGGWLVTRRGPI